MNSIPPGNINKMHYPRYTFWTLIIRYFRPLFTLYRYVYRYEPPTGGNPTVLFYISRYTTLIIRETLVISGNSGRFLTLYRYTGMNRIPPGNTSVLMHFPRYTFGTLIIVYFREFREWAVYRHIGIPPMGTLLNFFPRFSTPNYSGKPSITFTNAY